MCYKQRGIGNFEWERLDDVWFYLTLPQIADSSEYVFCFQGIKKASIINLGVNEI